jgi:hypothetical protein
MRGRMRSGAVPAVTRAPTPTLGVQRMTAAGGPPPRDPATARRYVALFAITVLVSWAIWKFGNFGAP